MDPGEMIAAGSIQGPAILLSIGIMILSAGLLVVTYALWRIANQLGIYA
jgi:hypothetical protein